MSIFAIIALTHPSAGSGCTKPCCSEKNDCGVDSVDVYCETRIPCGAGCGTCRPVVPPCKYPCCLENSDCGVGVGVYCNVTNPCGPVSAVCGTCEVVH